MIQRQEYKKALLLSRSLPHSGAILYRFQTLLIQSESIFESHLSP